MPGIIIKQFWMTHVWSRKTWLQRKDPTATSGWVQNEGETGGFDKEGEENYILAGDY